MKHFPGLFAFLCHKFTRDGQQPGEAGLDDLVEVGPVLSISGFESVGPADGQEALQTSEDRRWIIGIQELYRKVHKGWPFLGEVPVQNPLQDGNELLPDQSLRRGQNGQ